MGDRTRQFVITVTLALCLAGCVSTQVKRASRDLDRQMNALIGVSRAQLMALKGRPDRSVTLEASGGHGRYVLQGGTVVDADEVLVYLSQVQFHGSRATGYYQPQQPQNINVTVNTQQQPFHLADAIGQPGPLPAPPVPVIESTTDTVYYYQVYLVRSGKVVAWERRPAE